MKKLFTHYIWCALALVAMTASVNAQSVLLFEDFEDGTLPTGWTRVQNSGSNGWEFGMTSYTSADWAIPTHPSGGNQFAAANDDNCNCDAGEDQLWTPTMDWTPFDSVAIIFDEFYDGIWGGNAYVEISTDGGSNWLTFVIPDSANWFLNIGATLDAATYGPFTNNTVVRFVYTDNGGWADGFAVDNVLILGYRDVCSEVLNLSCNTPATVNLTGSGDFFWDFDECWATPGWEQLYQFTPTTTGPHYINVTSTNNEWVDYLWKPVSLGCDTGNWTCIADMQTAGIAGTINLTAGVPIYIVVDAEDPSAVSTHTFELLCACSAPTMPSGTPENEACGDSINGGCNMGIPAYSTLSCGETVVGNIFADGSTRDLDWYQFTVTQTTNVTVSAAGGFLMNLAIIDNCTNMADLGTDIAVPACGTASVTANLVPGTYIAIVWPATFDNHPSCADANSQYWVRLDMGSPSVSIAPSGPINICQGSATDLTASATGGTPIYSYIWDNAATGPNNNGVAGGIHCVTVTDANGCVHDTCTTVTEVSAPSADYSLSQSGTSVNFTDLSSPTPDTWHWDFGDSNTSSMASPTHTFSGGPGSYLVALIAGANPGCLDTVAGLVNVSSTGCAPQIVAGPDNLNHLAGFDIDTASVTNGYTNLVSYTDYTGSPVTVLNRGGTYNLTFHGAGSDYETFGAWIDYNQNGTFEAGELLGECSATGGSCTINFTVPVGANLGNATIRLIAQETVSGNIDPCANFYDFGESEDHTVQIDDVVGAEELTIVSFEVYPNPTEGMLNISFQTEEANSLEVRITNAIGQVVFNDARSYFNGTYNNAIDLSNLATGNYMLQVITEKGMINKKVIVK